MELSLARLIRNILIFVFFLTFSTGAHAWPGKGLWDKAKDAAGTVADVGRGVVDGVVDVGGCIVTLCFLPDNDDTTYITTTVEPSEPATESTESFEEPKSNYSDNKKGSESEKVARPSKQYHRPANIPDKIANGLKVNYRGVVSGASSLTIRSEPWYPAPVVGYLMKGESITILAEVGNWLDIGSGYIYRTYIQPSSEPQTGLKVNYSGSVTNAPNGLNVRSAPSMSASIVGALANHESISIKEEVGSWLMIDWHTPNGTAFISKDFFEAVSSNDPPAPESTTEELTEEADNKILDAGNNWDLLRLINPRTGNEYTDRDVKKVYRVYGLKEQIRYAEYKIEELNRQIGAFKDNYTDEHSYLDNLEKQKISLERRIDALREDINYLNGAADIDEIRIQTNLVAQLNKDLNELNEETEKLRNDFNSPGYRPGGMLYEITQNNYRIGMLELDLERANRGFRPLRLDFNNSESRAYHSKAAGIDESLLNATIKHEGGNFHRFGFAWRTIQESANDVSDVIPDAIKEGDIDSSVGYGQVASEFREKISRETFGLDWSDEEIRERLTSNDNFSNAIVAEALTQTLRELPPEYRANRFVFTAYAMSPGLIEKFSNVGWDFDKAKKLVEIDPVTKKSQITQESYDIVKRRFYEHWENAK